MSIAGLTANHVRIPLKRSVRHASHERTDTDSLIVRCELADGSVGWGEGLPREYVTGESIDDAWKILQARHVAEQLSGQFESLSAAIECLDGFEVLPSDLRHQIGDDRYRQIRSFIDRNCFGNSVRCAIEIAVLDAVCRNAGVPLAHITTLLPEVTALRQQASEVRYSGIITAERTLARLHAALKQRVYGFRQIKVKVGTSGTNDLPMLQRIRWIIGRHVELRIDANEAWDCASLVDRLAPMADVGICSVEQPVPHAQVGGLATIREQLEIPLMLDESLCSEHDARRAIDEGLCDLFNIRLSKCGGFLPSLRMAALAHESGLGYQLGCQVGETGILSAAGRQFATSIAGIRCLEGSYDRHLVRERLTQEDLTFAFGGRATALAAPGLGVTVADADLARVSQRQCKLL